MRNYSSLEQFTTYTLFDFFHLLSENIYSKTSKRESVSEQPLLPIDFDALERWVSSQEITPATAVRGGNAYEVAANDLNSSKKRSA